LKEDDELYGRVQVAKRQMQSTGDATLF
jgi:hypothetical protein